MVTKYPIKIPWEICLAQFRNLHKEDMFTEEYAVRLSSDLIPYTELDDDSSHDNIILGIYNAVMGKTTRKLTMKKYEEIRPYFL
jgi:hypothetical protein